MADLVTRLERLIRLCLLERMPADPSGELEAMELRALLTVYGNWRARVPSTTPREPHMSSVLAASAKRIQHAKAVEDITSKIAAGADLAEHLSERVKVAYVPTGSRGPRHLRKDLDLLLADWGIHHLHLPTETRQRGDDLLFAAFTERDAYLIDILPHGLWTKMSLIETIVREWPESGLVLRSQTGARPNHTWNDEDRAELRNAGLAILVEVDGVACMPPSATLGGMPSVVARRVMGLMWTLHEWRSDTLERLNAIRASGPGVYWVPIVREEEFGFTDGDLFVSVGRLA